jgi:hypothetical protein
VRPSQAAKSALGTVSAGGARAAIAVAEIGPMPERSSACAIPRLASLPRDLFVGSALPSIGEQV